MRIVAHNGARILGGAERATVLLLSGLQSRGHEILLLCNEKIVADHATSAGIQAKISIVGGDLSLIYATKFAATLAASKPDAFIVGTWKKLFFASWAAKRANTQRVVARVGLESDTPRSWKYKHALRNWTDAVVVNSSRMAASFATLDGFGSDKTFVIHNGVIRPSTPALPGKLRSELHIPPAARVIGTVARLAKQKRLDRFLRAFAFLPHDTHCIIAGDGSERGSLQQIALTLGIDGRSHFVGHRENKKEILDAIDVFVITSDQEGMSNSMLEAMACGVPVVSTPVGGADEALIGSDPHDMAGVVVTSFDEKAISAAIADLLDHSDMRQKMGRAALHRASTLFSLDTMLDKWEDVLAPSR